MFDHEALINRIYEVSAVPGEWPSLLHDLSGIVEGQGACFTVKRNDSWLGGCGSPGVAPFMQEFLYSENARRSTAAMKLVAVNRAGFVADYEIFTEDEITSDPSYTDWAAPNGTHYGAATAIVVPNGDIGLIQVQRTRGKPAFSRSDLDLLDKFRPHLARSALLAARWRMERLHVAAEALALIGLPAAVLSLSGKVLATNSLIETMTEFVIWRPGNLVAFVDRSATTILEKGIAGLKSPAAADVRSFPVKSMTPGALAIAHLIPITGEARDLFDGAFGVLVLTPVNPSHAPGLAIIRGLFDLTPTEAKVASAITAGLSVEEIATRHTVSFETVRAQVKAIFAKTGTNRQSQVASLLAGLPSFPMT